VRIYRRLPTNGMRDRDYWSNIRTKETMLDVVTDIPQPKDMGIMFKDIITDGYVERIKSKSLLEHTENSFGHKDRFSETAQEYIKSREKFGASLVYVDTDKHVSLKTNQYQSNSQRYLKHRNETTGMITLIKKDGLVRTVNKIEMCRLQGFPDNYCDILSTKKAGSLLGDGWTLPIIEHIFKFIKQ